MTPSNSLLLVVDIQETLRRPVTTPPIGTFSASGWSTITCLLLRSMSHTKVSVGNDRDVIRNENGLWMRDTSRYSPFGEGETPL